MRKLQRVAAAAALAAAGLGVAGAAANAATAAPGHRTQAAAVSWGGAGPIRDLPGFESSLKDEVSAR